MGEIKIDGMDTKKDFLGGMPEEEFFTRLNVLRKNGGHK
jgi:hypothetical protein